MGRATEFIEFINRKEMPSAEELSADFNYISTTEELKLIRRKYRRAIKDG